MKFFAFICVTCVAVVAANDERVIEDAFRAAYSNRSDEIGEFFNQTFGPGGDAEEIANRFKTAWKGANEGVKEFVNETYWNISRTMKGSDGMEASLASYPVAGTGKHDSDVSRHVKSVPVHPKPESEPRSILDTAWNYFKSVFGVTPDRNADPVPMTAPASIPSPHESHHSTMLGLVTLLAGIFLLIQAGVNRNSLINKQVSHRSPEVVPGYIRLV